MTFPGPRRRSRVLLAGAICLLLALGGCSATPAAPATVTPFGYPAAAGATAVFLGDSYTRGTGTSSPSRDWASLVSAEYHWKQVNLGRSGTGYISFIAAKYCAEIDCGPYATRLPAVAAADPSVVVVAGGQNDWIHPTETVVSAIKSLYTALRKQQPTAWVICVGPSSPTTVTAEARATSAAVHAECDRIRGTFVDLLNPDVIQQNWILGDHIHVNDDGHAAIAKRVEQAIDAVH